MFDKFYYIADSNVNLDEAIKKYLEKKAKNDDLKFVVLVDDNILLDGDGVKYQNLISNLNRRGIMAEDIAVSVDTQKHSFTPQEWERLKNIGVYFLQNDVFFGFEDMRNTWTIEEVERANSKISYAAQKLKESTLSPYEKLLSAYMKVARREYVSEDKDDHYSQSRSVYGVLNSEKIVCVGFSELLKAIMNEVGDENIKIYSNRVAVSADNIYASGYHANLIVYLKDEKYGINGYYYLDPTWDCVAHKGETPSVSYFMIPLKNIKNIRGNIKNISLRRAPQDQEAAKAEKAQKKSYEVDNSQKEPKKISFSGDSLSLNSELVMDLLQNPELFKALKEKYIDYKLKDSFALDIEEIKKAIEFVSNAKEVVQDYGVPFVGYKGRYKCWDYIGDIEGYARYQGELREKYLKRRSADSIQTFLDDFNKKAQSRIQSKESFLSLDMEYYDELSKEKIKAMKILPDFADYSDEELREKAQNGYELKTLAKDIALKKDKIDVMKEKLQEINSNLQQLFEKDSDFINRFCPLEDGQVGRFLQDLIDIVRYGEESDMPHIKKLLKGFNDYSQNEELDAMLVSYKEREEEYLKHKKEFENKSNVQILQELQELKEYTYNDCLQSWIEEILFDSSPDIDDSKLKMALKQVYLENGASPEKVDAHIDEILEKKAKYEHYVYKSEEANKSQV